MSRKLIVPAILAALWATPAVAQTAGGVNLVGPSTTPGAPQITPATINAAVNAALGAKVDVNNGVMNNPTMTGTTTSSGINDGATIAATNLSVAGTLSGVGLSNYLAAPPGIGLITPATGAFTTLGATGTSTLADGVASGAWTFNAGLTGTLTGAASLNLLLTGGSLTGPLHMGAYALDGSAVDFTGGALNGVSVGLSVPSAGAFTTLGATGAAALADGTASGPWAFNGAFASQIGTSILKSGTLCNGTGDDAATLNTWLAALPHGTTVVIPPGKMCVVGSASLAIPTSIRIVGSGDPMVMIVGGTNPTPASGFYVTPPNQIVMGAASTLENMDVIASGLISNPTDAQMITQVTAWQAQSSVGIYLPPGHGGGTLRHLFVAGFNTPILVRTAQYTLKELFIDGVNGLVSTRGFDQATIEGVFAEPWLCINSTNCPGTAGGQNRPGAGIYLGGEGGAQFLRRAFQLGYYSGIILDRLGGSSKVDDVGSEWDSTQGYGSVYNGVGSTAFKFVGTGGPTTTTNLFPNGQAISYDIEGYAGISNALYYPIGVNSFGVAAFWLKAADNATCSKVTVGGTIHAGDTISITVTSASLTSSVTVTHTVNADDDLGSIEADLLVRLNTDPYMSAAHFYAQADTTANAVSVYWPAASTATVTSAVTGSLTSAISATAGLGAASGTFRNISGPGGAVSLPTFAPVGAVQSITIEGTPMYTNLIGPGVIASPTWAISGLSYKAGPTFSGGISAVALGNSNDAAGLGTEANGATGGTVTFAYTWPWRPNCTVTGQAGMTPLTITASTTSLVWTNTALGAAQNVRYTCGFF